MRQSGWSGFADEDTKKAPDDAGAFQFLEAQERSVSGGDRRPAPVEAIDQRGADGLDHRPEGDGIESRQAGHVIQLLDVLSIVLGDTILGLHEQARPVDTEDIQAVFDTAADEPTVGIEAVRVRIQ